MYIYIFLLLLLLPLPLLGDTLSTLSHTIHILRTITFSYYHYYSLLFLWVALSTPSRANSSKLRHSCIAYSKTSSNGHIANMSSFSAAFATLSAASLISHAAGSARPVMLAACLQHLKPGCRQSSPPYPGSRIAHSLGRTWGRGPQARPSPRSCEQS